MGILLTLKAAFFFSFAGLSVKKANLHPLSIVISRSIIDVAVYLPIALFMKMNLLGVPGERSAMIARAVCGFVSYSLLYISYRLIPYADACTIFAATPVFVIVIAFLFLGESCGLRLQCS